MYVGGNWWLLMTSLKRPRLIGEQKMSYTINCVSEWEVCLLVIWSWELSHVKQNKMNKTDMNTYYVPYTFCIENRAMKKIDRVSTLIDKYRILCQHVGGHLAYTLWWWPKKTSMKKWAREKRSSERKGLAEAAWKPRKNRKRKQVWETTSSFPRPDQNLQEREWHKVFDSSQKGFCESFWHFYFEGNKHDQIGS